MNKDVKKSPFLVSLSTLGYLEQEPSICKRVKYIFFFRTLICFRDQHSTSLPGRRASACLQFFILSTTQPLFSKTLNKHEAWSLSSVVCRGRGRRRGKKFLEHRGSNLTWERIVFLMVVFVVMKKWTNSVGIRALSTYESVSLLPQNAPSQLSMFFYMGGRLSFSARTYKLICHSPLQYPSYVSVF